MPTPTAWCASSGRTTARWCSPTGSGGATGPPATTCVEANGLEARLAADRPAVYGGWQLSVEPLKDTVSGASRQPLLLIFAALGLLNLAMCANLANLVLVRLLGRRGELAVHMALGGSRGVVARQLGIESAVLAIAGGLAGSGLAALAIPRLPEWLPFELPRLGEVTLDAQPVTFALVLTVVVAALSGWLPAWIGSQGAIAHELRASGRGQTMRVGLLRSGSIVAQVAVALPLLVGAGLLVRSLLLLEAAELGMRPAGVVSARVSVGFDLYPEPAARAAFFQGLLADVRARPEVLAAGDLDPLGRRITSEVLFEDEAATRTVVGVVEDVAHLGPGSPAGS